MSGTLDPMSRGFDSGAHVGDDQRHSFAEYRFDCADLPDAFSVTDFEASEALNAPYRWTVRLQPEHETTDSYQLLGRDATLSIVVRDTERCFCGIVDRVTIDQDAHRGQLCTVTVVPALSALARTLDTRIFQDKTALEIIEQVLGESLAPYGRTFESGAVDTSRLVTRNYCVQYRETSLDFVHRLLEEEGIGYYFTHAREVETLFLFDDNRSLPKPSAPEANPLHFWTASTAGTGHDERMIWFPGTCNRTSTSLATRDYDWRLGGRGELESKGSLTAPDARRPHEVYEHGVGRHHVIHEETNMLLGMAETLLTSLVGATMPIPIADDIYGLSGSVFDRFSSSNTEDRGRVRRQWHQRDAHVFEGISCVRELAAGSAFELVGHPRPEVDGEYFVTRITHSMAPSPSSVAGNEHFAHVNYHNRLHCLPRTTPWRPDWVTPKPRIDGIQTATVTGPPGLDVYTDPHGRIKVRFPWDRAETDLSGHYTCWLRVSQTWAGPTSPAFLFIPRVGMEVVVSFIDGDPDRPLVTGCVYNGDNATPALLPPQATKSIIRTRTVPFGAGYNELSFEDAAGMEHVHLRAERDLSELVQNNHDVRVAGHERLAIGGTQTERVGVDQNIQVGRHYRRTIGGNGLETTLGHHTRAVEGVAHEQLSCGYDIEVAAGGMSTRVPQGEWITEGRGVTLRAGSSMLRMTDEEEIEDLENDKGFTLISFGSSIHVTQDRIELKVGSSSLVMTPELVQVNGKTLPATGSPPAEEPSTPTT